MREMSEEMAMCFNAFRAKFYFFIRIPRISMSAPQVSRKTHSFPFNFIV